MDRTVNLRQRPDEPQLTGVSLIRLPERMEIREGTRTNTWPSGGCAGVGGYELESQRLRGRIDKFRTEITSEGCIGLYPASAIIA